MFKYCVKCVSGLVCVRVYEYGLSVYICGYWGYRFVSGCDCVSESMFVPTCVFVYECERMCVFLHVYM